MIPKIINYIWLSDEPLNEIAEKCIESWKENAPDFEIKRWKMSDFNFDEMPDWVNEAISVKKWAFATDYLRLYVLYNGGGFYFDSDVIMLKPVNQFLDNRFISAIEYSEKLFAESSYLVDEDGWSDSDIVDGVGVQAAIMGSEPGHPYVKEVMKFYESNHFILSDGSYNNTALAPNIYAKIAKDFGFRYVNKRQNLEEGIILLESPVFAPRYEDSDESSILIHFCTGTWIDVNNLMKKARYLGRKLEVNIIETDKRYGIIKSVKIYVYRVLKGMMDLIRKNGNKI